MKKSHYVFFPNETFPEHMSILPQSGGARGGNPLNNTCTPLSWTAFRIIESRDKCTQGFSLTENLFRENLVRDILVRNINT
jgi:hypothetical protein